MTRHGQTLRENLSLQSPPAATQNRLRDLATLDSSPCSVLGHHLQHQIVAPAVLPIHTPIETRTRAKRRNTEQWLLNQSWTTTTPRSWRTRSQKPGRVTRSGIPARSGSGCTSTTVARPHFSRHGG